MQHHVTPDEAKMYEHMMNLLVIEGVALWAWMFGIVVLLFKISDKREAKKRALKKAAFTVRKSEPWTMPVDRNPFDRN